MSKSIDVSVIILNQTLKNLELIIVNDGGNNLEVIKSFNDKRIVILNHEKTKGLPISLNEAIDKCKGKYIARMDSDDISKLNRLEIQKKYLDIHSNIDICAMFYKKFYEENDFIINSLYNYNDIASQLFFRNVLAHPTIMFRRSFLIENNLRYSLEYEYSQDFEFWTRCIKKGNISLIPKLGLYYRIHRDQIRSSKKDKQKFLYESVLLRNLKELEIEESNIRFINILNENNSSKINFIQLSNFIDLIIKKNNIKKIYNSKSLKKVLYNAFFKLIIKNKEFNSLLNIKIAFKFFYIANFLNAFFYSMLKIKIKISNVFDNTIVNISIF